MERPTRSLIDMKKWWAEVLKYPPGEYFTRPGSKEMYGSFDDSGFPTSMADGTRLNKSQIWALRKELEQYTGWSEDYRAKYTN